MTGNRKGQPLPYFIAPGPAARRRILLISYHAPPSNEVGALRWAGMARHFATEGWGLDFLTVDPSQLQPRNEALLETLPPGTRLYGCKEEPSALDRAVSAVIRLRQKSKVKREESPDPGARPGEPTSYPGSRGRQVLNAFHVWREYARYRAWAHRVADLGRRLVEPGVHRWVASSGPPHMSHEGGRLLSTLTGLPFIADFRDPWTPRTWTPPSPLWFRLAEHYEAPVFEQATLVVANTEPVRSLFEKKYPKARVITITNGIDEDVIPAPAVSGKFILGHPGTIYAGRDPTPLFQAVAEIVRVEGLTPSEIGLEFMGHSGPEVDAWLHRLASSHGIAPFVTVRPGAPRTEALNFMATCSVLVALQQGTDLAIPAKLFEYMRFPAWQLVLAGAGSATAVLLEGAGADVMEPHDAAGVTSALLARYREFRNGIRPAPLGTQERFTRRHQAERLLKAMEAVRAGRGAGLGSGGSTEGGETTD